MNNMVIEMKMFVHTHTQYLVSCAVPKTGRKRNYVHVHVVSTGRRRTEIFKFNQKEADELHPLLTSYREAARLGSYTVECIIALNALIDVACDMKGVCPNSQGKQMKYQLLSCHQIEKVLTGSKLSDHKAVSKSEYP